MTPEKMAEFDEKLEEQKRITGDRVKELIKERGLSQTRAADGIGISQSVLSDIVTKKRVISAENILKLCDYFQVSSDYLLGFTDVRARDQSIAGAAEVTGISPQAVSTLKAWNIGRSLTQQPDGPDRTAFIETDSFVSLLLNKILGTPVSVSSFTAYVQHAAKKFCHMDPAALDIDAIGKLAGGEFDGKQSEAEEGAETLALSRVLASEIIGRAAQDAFNDYCRAYRENYEKAVEEN